MVATKSEILKLIREKEERLKELGVSRLALFGSFLHDEIDSDSDVDLIVEFQPGKKNFINYSNLIFFLEDLFERDVEIVTEESLSPYFGPKIVGEAEYVTLYA